MPRFLTKVAPDRDAYIEWSTVVDSPVGIGTRTECAAQGWEDWRLDQTDKNGTSAMWFDWLPGREQQGGWDDDYLLVAEAAEKTIGTLPRQRLGDLYDLLAEDINAKVPQDWLGPWGDSA